MNFLATIGHALLFSEDAGAVELCSRSFRSLAMDLEVTSDLTTFLLKAKRQKFEAILVDFKAGERASTALVEARKLASSRNAVAFALTTGAEDGKQAFQAGAHFILERPLTTQSLERTLRPAYGMILRERRRYFRCPIASVIHIRQKDGSTWNCTSINVSEGGICAMFPEKLHTGDEVKIDVPIDQIQIQASCEVCWSLEDGLTGLKFTWMPSEMKTSLQIWLAQRLEALCPPAVIASVTGHVEVQS